MKAQRPRKRRRKRKCKCCGELYMPDARHFRDQAHCEKPTCRHASKRASHRRWLLSEKGAEYRDPEENKRRVRLWRVATPGYWKRTARKGSVALRETTISQPVDDKDLAPSLVVDALQDPIFTQPALVVGLIASLTGSALQETIVETSRRFVLLGQDILGNGPGTAKRGDRRYADHQTNPVSGAPAPNTESLQLGRPPPGA